MSLIFIKMAYKAREVRIGNLWLGGNQPIRVQSMTSTHTLDTLATVEQSIRIIEAGGELVRITAPGLKEAANLRVIKNELKKRGYVVPLIADIHFNPHAAEIAARIVEKVRINPGNYTDKSNVKTAFPEKEYALEIERIWERLKPLLKICKEYGTAIRIGVNHGSLSQRILNRYGDTPEGMVQSALEFTRICNEEGFQNLVLSMKSSNVQLMVQACRLLADRLALEGLNYPLHIGVTEAADGEDGRLKSVAGIGALLARGIGDTIRVSLTESPELELPVAKAIVNRFQYKHTPEDTRRYIRPDLEIHHEIERIPFFSDGKGRIGGKNPPAVVLKYKGTYFMAEENGSRTPLTETLLYISDIQIQSALAVFVDTLQQQPDAVIVVEAGSGSVRQLINALRDAGLNPPILLKSPQEVNNVADALIENALNPGNLLLDSLGDGIILDADILGEEAAVRIGYGLLQITRRRISRTEFIACPSCGRTLFNIQEALREVKVRTAHLKGLKIAVMGCVVNGPGEMADADYGYVGAGNGKVNLYKGKEAVSRSISEVDAVEALVQLIKANGDWRD